MAKTKEKKYEVGDTVKLTKESWGFDEYNAKQAMASGSLVYTLKVEKVERVILVLGKE